jgi:hypothetical protein
MALPFTALTSGASNMQTFSHTIARHAAAVLALSALAFGAHAQGAMPAKPAQAATPAESVSAGFKRADLNGDGKLSREEAARVPALADKFDAADKNKDGQLDLDEVTAALQAAPTK